MKAINVPVLLRRIGVSKDLVQVILFKKILDYLGRKSAIIVISDFDIYATF